MLGAATAAVGPGELIVRALPSIAAIAAAYFGWRAKREVTLGTRDRRGRRMPIQLGHWRMERRPTFREAVSDRLDKLEEGQSYFRDRISEIEGKIEA